MVFCDQCVNEGWSLYLLLLIISDALCCRNDKGKTVVASYYHAVNMLSNTAVGGEVTHSLSTNENSITIGTQHALDPLTLLKARVNNSGKVSALIQHEWRPRSLFTISAEVDTRSIEKTAKVGLALALKPWERSVNSFVWRQLSRHRNAAILFRPLMCSLSLVLGPYCWRPCSLVVMWLS